MIFVLWAASWFFLFCFSLCGEAVAEGVGVICSWICPPLDEAAEPGSWKLIPEPIILVNVKTCCCCCGLFEMTLIGSKLAALIVAELLTVVVDEEAEDETPPAVLVAAGAPRWRTRICRWRSLAWTKPFWQCSHENGYCFECFEISWSLRCSFR